MDEKGNILGHISASLANYLSDPANGRVAEAKQGFVKPGHRREGISSTLLDAVESEIRAKNYDFVIGSAVCGHSNSQNLCLGKGYRATAFAPNILNAAMTRTSQRESLLFVVKAVSEGGKASQESHKTVYVPPEALDVLAAAYSTAGLSQLRSIVVDGNTPLNETERAWVKTRLTGQISEASMLPHDTVDITNPERSRLRAYMEAGYVPVGVLPFGTDRIIMMYVPSGLKFDPSKVQIVDKAKPLAETVGRLYDQMAARS